MTNGLKGPSGSTARAAVSRRSWLGGHEGSVSVFLIMVLAFVFLFTAVLIDYARIAAAHVQEERLARAAVRSVMSAYNVDLREQYGLFAFGGSDGNQLLSGVLNDNLHRSGREDAFAIMPLGLESSSLEFSRPLGSYDVFRRQITEEMKYKAPVDFALELAGKFKPLSAAMAEASRSTELLGRMQPLYDEREQALELMASRRKQAAEEVRKVMRLVMDPPGGSIYPTAINTVSTAADMAAQYSDYVDKTMFDLSRENWQATRFTEVCSRYRLKSGDVLSRLPASLNTFRAEYEKLAGEAGAALEQARSLNEQMRVLLEQSRSSVPDAAADPASQWDIPGSQDGMSAEPLRKLREQEDALIISSADFDLLLSQLSAQNQASLAVDPAVTGLVGVLNETTGIYGNPSSIISAVVHTSNMVSTYVNNYGEGGAIIGGELAGIEQYRSVNEQRKQVERQAKAELGGVENLLEKIRRLGDGATAAKQRYELLYQYFEDNRQFNEGLEQESSAAATDSDPYRAGSTAMKDMDGIYAAMGSVLQGGRDRLFQTEYAAQYFRHFDSAGLAAALAQTGAGAEGQLAEQLDPHAQELEYILYGFHNPAGNIAAAYGEIFAMRLAIRTMEGFIEKAGMGNPLLVLAAALLYGIQQAVQDMLLLYEKGAIPLSKYMPAQLSYRDHLRIFMLLHGGGEVQLSRMLAVIRLNTGIDTTAIHTYAAAEVKLGLRLWFLPGVVRLLETSGGIFGEVQGSTYYRTAQAEFSY
ncbi:hypothetical protein [Paenibacillus donghaensis]|uniref:Uncharacterized protein n=1 Tax=Paenibacillus donghaensis TaxID=414771 RepID=A0A2Z2K525_9BACL|nr:hypothetical protein [Paenibacillus donghaensis]ASA19554.1 hypothetical protein B9T62_01185 [Paenibacillus donghaensis]